MGDQRGWCVLGALTGAPLCSSQWGKKMKQRRLLFAPYLVPPTPRCGDFFLKGFYGGAGGRGETLEKFLRKLEKICAGEDAKRLFCMVFNAFFFPGGLWDSCRGAVPPMTVCLPVRMGTECLRLDACAGFMERMELALWNCE